MTRWSWCICCFYLSSYFSIFHSKNWTNPPHGITTIRFTTRFFHCQWTISITKSVNNCKPLSVHQLLFELCLVLSLEVTVANYGILQKEIGGAADIHQHIMNCKRLDKAWANIFFVFIAVVMVTQLIFLNTPIRLFHVIYGWALALIYCLNTYIAFTVDERRNRLFNHNLSGYLHMYIFIL